MSQLLTSIQGQQLFDQEVQEKNTFESRLNHFLLNLG